MATPTDTLDEGILQRTLYGTLKPDDLSLEQSKEMVAAAERRVQRAEEVLEQAKGLVEQGVLARNEMKPVAEELEYRQRTLELARSRARFLEELAEMARVEVAQEPQDDGGPKPIQERFEGNGHFSPSLLRQVLLAYEKQFGKAMPVSANGETAFHKALGFDHRGRMDVAVLPDQAEGVWLRHYLEQEQIPYYAFRGAVSGRASAAHIHIGPPSTRLRVAD